ncbi:unnamed protein product [Schistosoma spindalis]|nr:unnamed protein product [Schistosoma spindale]
MDDRQTLFVMCQAFTSFKKAIVSVIATLGLHIRQDMKERENNPSYLKLSCLTTTQDILQSIPCTSS